MNTLEEHRIAPAIGSPCPHDEAIVEPALPGDPAALRALVVEERNQRRRAECMAKIQTDVMQLAVDLLVQEPKIDDFFAAFLRTLVEESESRGAGVWLVDEERQEARLWMAHAQGQLITADRPDWERLAIPRESMAEHLYTSREGWTSIVEYAADDERLPAALRQVHREMDVHALAIAPMTIGPRTLGWITLSAGRTSLCEGEWRLAMLDAIARQATLALHHNQVAEKSRVEERRKAILEERNRLARDIHDTLAQGFAAILMQLQGAQREAGGLSPKVASKLETAVDLARTHILEARRSVCALRPQVGSGEDLASALKRLADLAGRGSDVPIDLNIDDLPRYGDVVEREVAGIAQEALNNAIRHARAGRITVRASAARSIGLRLSIADDGRGIARERRASGFGMTSMQERAERIGASLTIVTAHRAGTEVVVAWEPTAMPPHAHVTA